MLSYTFGLFEMLPSIATFFFYLTAFVMDVCITAYVVMYS